MRAVVLGALLATVVALSPFAASAAHAVTPDVAPTITAISPSSGYESGGTRVTITGTGFDTDATGNIVEFGSVGGDAVSATSTSLVVLSPPSVDTGPVAVTVQVGGSSGPTSNSEPFTYLASVPIVAIEGGNKAMYVSAGGGRFVNYGGALKGAPSVVSSNDRNYYFVRGTDNNLYVRDDKTAYTKLRPSAPLDCATAPAATTHYPDGRFVVACVGTNGTLYTAAGALPATGNPTVTALYPTPGTYGSDLTATKGGVGADQVGALLVIGRGYGSSGPQKIAAGNTYQIAVDDQTGHSAVDFRLGGSCAGAPQVAVPETNVFDVICRRTASAGTVVYRVSYPSSSIVTTTTINLGGAAIGSPAATTGGSGAVEVLVAGTNGRLYAATVEGSSATAFRGLPIAGVAASGPGINAGPPPADTSATRRAHGWR